MMHLHRSQIFSFTKLPQSRKNKNDLLWSLSQVAIRIYRGTALSTLPKHRN